MIIESGVIVALGLVFMFAKMKWTWRMKVLSNPLAMDVIVFVVMNALHWGTFSGVMVAATGSLICSALISLGRWLYGYVENGLYYAGHFNVIEQLRLK